MFLYDFIQIDRPFEEVRARLLEARPEWLRRLASQAEAEGGSHLVRVGLDGGARGVSKEVELELGEPYQRETMAALPIWWRATGVPGLFPSLKGDLEIARLGSAPTVAGHGR